MHQLQDNIKQNIDLKTGLNDDKYRCAEMPDDVSMAGD